MRYESGETEPSLSDLKQMASVFEVEPDELFDDYYRFLAYPCTQKIKAARRERRLTQAAYGEIVGVVAGTVKRWESGRNTITREVWEVLKAQELL